MELGCLEIGIGLSILLLGFYYYFTCNFDFWKKHNVVGPKPIPIFGNLMEVILGKIHICLLMQRYYNEFKGESMVGFFSVKGPVLLVKDLDLIKDVLIKDFNIFHDRGFHISPKLDPIEATLINLEYKRWKPLRANLSPTFSSSKLKDMFYLLAETAENFEKYIEKISKKSDPIECRELAAKFTTDTITVCAFGLNSQSFDDENNKFRAYGRTVFEINPMTIIRHLIRDFLPAIYDILGTRLHDKSREFFIKSIQETVSYRKKNNVRRNDFLDLLTDLKDKKDKISNIDFTDRFITGQAILFFTAGFETSSTTISNTFYELALNQSIQDKLRQEIKKELEISEGRVTYDTLKRMTYLEQVINETLRKYPPGGALHRKASAPYTFTGTNISIPKDTNIYIPVHSIHYDPGIYPSPDTFDPERFSEENVKLRHPMSFLPFGGGPHNCIGMRFAYYQTKIGIVTLINKFKLDVCEKTCIPYRIEPRAVIFATPIGGIYLKITKV